MEISKRKLNKSIKIKLFMYLLGFCALLLMFLWFFQIIFLDSFYKWTKLKNLEYVAAAIEQHVNEEDFEETATELSNRYEICLIVAPTDGQAEMEVIGNHVAGNCYIHKILDFSSLIEKTRDAGGQLTQEPNLSSTFKEEKDPKSQDPGIFQNGLPIDDTPKDMRTPSGTAPATEQGSSTKSQGQGASGTNPASNLPANDNRFMFPGAFRNRDNMEGITYTKIVDTINNGEIIIMLDCIITPVSATVQTLQIQLYFVTVFMVIFSIIIALAMSKKVARPIIEINESAKILATGNYDVDFPGGSYSEVDELSQTLNYAAKELEKTDALQKELVANISHDLRTPLTLIAGYAEAMRDLPGEDNVENAQVIIDEANKLSSLVKDVLDISKVQSGVQTLHLTKFNITEILESYIGRMREFLEKDGYELIFDYDEEVFVKADETRISQVFYNLLNNAVHYTGDDKKIYIRQTVTDKKIKIEVTDTGQGIEPENLNNIWERYYKLNEVHRRNIYGAGLGLSIVKSAIALHGGEYGVTSEIGVGSTFYFCLPIDA